MSAVALVMFVLAAAVVAPLTRGGHVFLLDWVIGPHSTLPRTAWGLDGGVTNGLPFTGVMLLAEQVIGSAATWLPLALFFPAAGIAVATLAGGSTTTRLAAALVYCVNPVVFERTAVGQFPYLVAYALFPLLVRALVDVDDSTSYWRTGPALVTAAAVASSPHFGWIGVVVSIVSFALGPISRRRAAWFAAYGSAVAVMSSYLLVLASGSQAGFTVGQDDLNAYRTTPDPRLGLLANVVGLYGFWRQGTLLPKSLLAGWPVFLVAILAVAGVGAIAALRDPQRSRLAVVLLVSAMLGLLLAMGDQGPTGSAYRWMFDHLPLFAIMREPQKFIVLVALPYAVLFGWGAHWLVQRSSSRAASAAASSVVFMLPIAYTPSLFWGLRGEVRAVDTPRSWSAADAKIGDGVGRVLVLPWHQYLAFDFTRRVIANPADALLRREVIVGDNVELSGVATTSTSPRSRYLEFLYRQGTSMCSFGQLTSPLGVEFVLLAKAVDHAEYAWLGAQRDLEVVVDNADLTIYRNLAWDGGRSTVGEPIVVDDWGALVELSDRGAIERPVVVAREFGPPRTRGECGPRPTPTPGSARISAVSRTRYEIDGIGGNGLVSIPEAPDPAWRLQGSRPVPLAGGASGFRFPGGNAEIVFSKWSTVRASYAVSIGASALLSAASIRDWNSRRRARRLRSQR